MPKSEILQPLILADEQAPIPRETQFVSGAPYRPFGYELHQHGVDGDAETIREYADQIRRQLGSTAIDRIDYVNRTSALTIDARRALGTAEDTSRLLGRFGVDLTVKELMSVAERVSGGSNLTSDYFVVMSTNSGYQLGELWTRMSEIRDGLALAPRTAVIARFWPGILAATAATDYTQLQIQHDQNVESNARVLPF